MRQPLTLLDLLPKEQSKQVLHFRGDEANLKQFENNFITNLDQNDLRFYVFNEKDGGVETISASNLTLDEVARLEKLKNIVDEFSMDEKKNIMFLVKNESGFCLRYLELNPKNLNFIKENQIDISQTKKLLDAISKIHKATYEMAMPEYLDDLDDLGSKSTKQDKTPESSKIKEMLLTGLDYFDQANKKNKFSFEINEEDTTIYMNVLNGSKENPNFIKFGISAQDLVKFYTDLSKDAKDANNEYLFYQGDGFSKIEINPESKNSKEIQENTPSFREIGEFLQRHFPKTLEGKSLPDSNPLSANGRGVAHKVDFRTLGF